ncbi:MAG: tripartite tricarboxylate transporter TctB family protein [Desulfobacteraceae bacterium]|nr:tripartite tricarboxylate transporter TctB family protein [Desulfobacteraceae bacterium]
MTLNRISGLAVIIGGAILLFWVIPHQTEIVDYGWLKPATLPRISAIIIIIAGLIHFIFPTGKADFDVVFSLRVGLFFVISCSGLYLMSLIGFVLAAPILIVVIMILIGERRPLWLISGIILLPASIWFCVSFLLNKPLP